MKVPSVMAEAVLVGLAAGQLATIQGAIDGVSKSLGSLDTAIMGLKDAATAPAVLTASTNVQTSIDTATKQVTGATTLGLTDALSLQNTAGTLTSSVQKTVGDLTNKKPLLDQLGVTSVALQTLQQQKTGSAALGKAIVSKVPAIGQGIAQSSIDQINTALDNGVKALMAPAAAGAKNATAAPGTMASSSNGQPLTQAAATEKMANGAVDSAMVGGSLCWGIVLALGVLLY